MTRSIPWAPGEAMVHVDGCTGDSPTESSGAFPNYWVYCYRCREFTDFRIELSRFRKRERAYVTGSHNGRDDWAEFDASRAADRI